MGSSTYSVVFHVSSGDGEPSSPPVFYLYTGRMPPRGSWADRGDRGSPCPLVNLWSNRGDNPPRVIGGLGYTELCYSKTKNEDDVEHRQSVTGVGFWILRSFRWRMGSVSLSFHLRMRSQECPKMDLQCVYVKSGETSIRWNTVQNRLLYRDDF